MPGHAYAKATLRSCAPLHPIRSLAKLKLISSPACAPLYGGGRPIDGPGTGSHIASMTAASIVSLVAAAFALLAAFLWIRVAARIEAIGAMDQRAYRRALGRAAVITALTFCLASAAVLLDLANAR